MTKLDWTKAKRPRIHHWMRPNHRATKPTAAQQVIAGLGPHKPGIPADRDGIWIVVGANRSPTTERMVRHFSTLTEAHEAGFKWAV